ncbi:hypothetical protein BT69DRAFT_901192 [Atractiella rhizophila]|nr:hypothetical protein BT69DRAFT_901192 [Atractiella rhizophila]
MMRLLDLLCLSFHRVRLRRVRRIAPTDDETTRSAVPSQEMTEQQTSSICHEFQEPNLRALVNFVTPFPYANTSIYVSILPSFFSHLPPSIRTLRVSVLLSRQLTRDWKPSKMSSKLSNLSLDCFENAVDVEGVINLCITINPEYVHVTFTASAAENDLKVDLQGDVNSFDRLFGYRYPRTFLLRPGCAIFAPIAVYSSGEGRFIPDERPYLPFRPDYEVNIVQLSVSPPSGTTPPSISCLPVELLTLIFGFVGTASARTLSFVCRLWKVHSVSYWDEVICATEGYARLKLSPGAGRLWKRLLFDDDICVEMVNDVITGSPNVTEVRMDAFSDEEKARIVLNAIEGLKRLDDISFTDVDLRKWRREEIENFMHDGIKKFAAYNVEDSVSSVSAGLHLSSCLETLILQKYPPLPSLILPQTLRYLHLSNVCPLPSCISEYPLPPLLERLKIELVPFSTDGNTSILHTPLDFSHLTHLIQMDLDGGEETSNLVSPWFFSTLKNVTMIRFISLEYCVVVSPEFPEFIHWFFGDWKVRGACMQMKPVPMGRRLEVRLFFGEWSEEEIVSARRMIGEYTLDGREGGVW